MWRQLMQFLELDTMTRRDLHLLCQSGVVRRTYANKLVWQLLNGFCSDPEYHDVSNWVSHQAQHARGQFDCPPAANPNMLR